MRGTGQQHLRAERVGGGAAGAQGGGTPVAFSGCSHVTEEEMQNQRHRFACPRAHSKGTTRAWTEAVPSPPFSRFRGRPGQSCSSVNIV